MSKDRLIIFDTTMRDGEQSPGASMTKDEKIRIARALERLNGALWWEASPIDGKRSMRPYLFIDGRPVADT